MKKSNKAEHKQSSTQSVIKLRDYSFVFSSLVKRQFAIKYSRAFAGIIWLFIPPIILTGLFFVFLGSQFNMEKTDYLIFLFSGLVLWSLFSNGVTTASNSLVANSEILKKVYFPRILFPSATIAWAFLEFCLLFCLLVLLLAFNLPQIHWLHFFINSSISILITFLTTIGLGYIIAALSVKFRDLLHALPFVIQVTMFASPVVIPLNVISNNNIKGILSFNPISGALQILRAGIFNQPLPTETYLIHLAISIVIVLVGIVFFTKREKFIVDYL